MGHATANIVPALTTVGLLLALAGCAHDPTLDLSAVDEPTEESATATSEAAPVSFTQPSLCTEILPASAVASLAEDGIELTQGPGSSSIEPIFVDGETPEERAGGISCLFSIPSDDESGVYVLLSVAPVDAAVRPEIIADFIDQGLSVGSAPDGAVTYWKWGDEIIVPAFHNSLYEDSWYSALLQPGGRAAYDRGVALVQAMRSATTG